MAFSAFWKKNAGLDGAEGGLDIGFGKLFALKAARSETDDRAEDQTS